MRVHIKGAFLASFKVQITAKGNTVAHNMARVEGWQKIAVRVNSEVKRFCILPKKYYVSSSLLPPYMWGPMFAPTNMGPSQK